MFRHIRVTIYARLVQIGIERTFSPDERRIDGLHERHMSPEDRVCGRVQYRVQTTRTTTENQIVQVESEYMIAFDLAPERPNSDIVMM
jgi:hypothetical protein